MPNSPDIVQNEHAKLMKGVDNPLLRELSLFIGREVDRQLKYRMASQNQEVVQELFDKFNYLVSQYNLPNPTAAEIAMWKAVKG